MRDPEDYNDVKAWLATNIRKISPSITETEIDRRVSRYLPSMTPSNTKVNCDKENANGLTKWKFDFGTGYMMEVNVRDEGGRMVSITHVRVYGAT